MTSLSILDEDNQKGKNRIKPYPPNFNITPAKIIDPATGASTWAFNSHKCTEYIGNLAKKAPTKNK
jgi:hypothetical protein